MTILSIITYFWPGLLAMGAARDKHLRERVQ